MARFAQTLGGRAGARLVRVAAWRGGAVALATVALVGCGSNLPFTGSGLSDTDKAFLAAAPSWDTNKDGVITCQDWTAYLTSLFQAADRNRDGVLSPEEFQTITATDKLFAIADFKYWDDRKQGRLTLAEMTAKPNPAFVLVDKNKDCTLDNMEVLAAESASDRPRATYKMPEAAGGDTRKGGMGN